MNHLQETAKHYANLAEQYRSQLAEEQELNENLMGLVEALCEELEIDSQVLLQEMGLISTIKGLLGGKKAKPKKEPKEEPKKEPKKEPKAGSGSKPTGTGPKPTGTGQSVEWQNAFG